MKILRVMVATASLVALATGSLGCGSNNTTGTGRNGGAGGLAGIPRTGGNSGGLGGSSGGANGAPCVGDYVPGDYPPALEDVNAWLEISGVPGQPNPRQYKVHVPPGYDCKVPTPLLFCIHGFMQNGVMFCLNGSASKTAGPRGFVDKSNQAGFVLVIPTGAGNAWNAGSCCGGSTNDDVALFRALVTEVSKHVNVDPKRIYATGLSNGGMMSYRLACDAADVFAAVAPAAAGVFTGTCNPSRPVPVLDIHGTADAIVPYSLQASSIQTMAMAAGCGAATTPAIVPTSGGDTTCVTRSGCPTGIEITTCTVAGGGHDWFGDPTCGTGSIPAACAIVGPNSNFLNNTDAVWDFLKRFSR